jgi:hypothetical protein
VAVTRGDIMGLFTYVNIDKDLLPEEYKDIFEWQTKDVVEPGLQRLKITKRGELVYHQIDQQPLTLNFHGDMRIYTTRNYEKESFDWIEGFARFTYGKLDNIVLRTGLPV